MFFLSCAASSNTNTYTGPPPRTGPLVNDTSYHQKLSDLPDSLQVDFEVPGNEPCSVRVELHNSATRLVRTVVDSVYSPGKYSLKWNKKDSAGQTIRQGLYYYKYYVCRDSFVRRMEYRARIID